MGIFSFEFESFNMKTIFVFLTLFALALALPKAEDCDKCKTDIGQAIKDCGGIPQVFQCIEDILMSFAECLKCVCEILAEQAGFDETTCQNEGNRKIYNH